MTEKINDELETGAKADAPQVVSSPSPLDLDGDGNIEQNETIVAVALIVAALLVGAGVLYAMSTGLITLEQLGGVLASIWTTVHTGQKALGK
jgi:hypothetical protein